MDFVNTLSTNEYTRNRMVWALRSIIKSEGVITFKERWKAMVQRIRWFMSDVVGVKIDGRNRRIDGNGRVPGSGAGGKGSAGFGGIRAQAPPPAPHGGYVTLLRLIIQFWGF